MSRWVRQEEIEMTTVGIGAKAKTLAAVSVECGHVPAFAVLPTMIVEELWKAEEETRILLIEELTTELREIFLEEQQFAVRSAALNEDQETSSQAGQFHTEIAIDWSGLGAALWKVVQIGVMRLKGQAELFSCFVQVYKEADVAGVTFTRGPEGDPRLFVEYHLGRGEALVSGAIQPQMLARFWGEEKPFTLPSISQTEELLFAWKRLEEYFGHPQDIEWCAVRGEWFLLQARPITTLSQTMYQGLLEADVVLPVRAPFFYEQTEIAELAPHPTSLTLSILERLYAEDGPIARVYERLGVAYDPRDFFSLVAGWLYVDREEEIKTLLPGFTVLDQKHPGIPQAEGLFGSWQLMKLHRALASACTPTPIQLGRLQDVLSQSVSDLTLQTWSQAFLMVYETIFLTNVAAQQELARLEPILDRTQMTSATMLASKRAFAWRLDLSVMAPMISSDWQGNGLDVADESPAVIHAEKIQPQGENSFDQWWQGLNALSRAAYEPVLRAAVQADQLREVGRWVTIRWINVLRALLTKEAAGHGISLTHSYHIRLDEWEAEALPSLEEQEERLMTYARTQEYCLPSRFTNLVLPEVSGLRGLSAGQVEGRLCLLEDIQTSSESAAVILLTEQLRPELAPLLGRVQGIVTARGGMLSHLAILAREQHLPVVSGVSFFEWQKQRGQKVLIDGEKGVIELGS
jgi:phosphohistidine swiveling domain-containing protein